MASPTVLEGVLLIHSILTEILPSAGLEQWQSLGWNSGEAFSIASLQVLQLDVTMAFNRTDRVSAAVIVPKPVRKFGSCETNQWDVRKVGGSVFVTAHSAYGTSNACLQKYSAEGQLQHIVKSEWFSEPNMIAIDF